ncbi:MAG: glutamate synthase large subunit [Chitinivibrionales bacterium]|nr:glutamate synthase large subunit [Chitinivibrionales bacterium]
MCGVGFVANSTGRKSHQIVAEGLTILANLVHRSRVVSEENSSGDGAGICLQLPHQFFAQECMKQSITMPREGFYGVAMVFLPRDTERYRRIRNIIDTVIAAEGFDCFLHRDVTTNPDILSPAAQRMLPAVDQFFLTTGTSNGPELERKLFILRRCLEKAAQKEGFSFDECYFPSVSCATIVYKGFMNGAQLPQFYSDLRASEVKSGFAIVHQRYSTNTFPSWHLAQPFRTISHNGEINSLRGNINKMKAREATLSCGLFNGDLSKLLPIIDPRLSDSGIFDAVYELLIQSGRSLEQTMMMMVPEPFGPKYYISQDKRSFYEFHASIMEPWDGPGAFIFTDGFKVGAALDRNGLRPLRFVITKSGKIVVASEVGVLDIAADEIVRKGRLGPGKMLLVDTLLQRILFDNEIKSSTARNKPYRRWVEENSIELKGLFQTSGPVELEPASLQVRQKVFGYGTEDISSVILPMALSSQEPMGSMGNDAALAVFCQQPQLLYSYFRQLFAQVTHPPIDPYRENVVMSLMSFIGRERNLLEEHPQCCHQLKLQHPILTNDDIQKLKSMNMKDFICHAMPILFSAAESIQTLDEALRMLCLNAQNAVDNGATLLILSDRGVDESNIPMPALLATAAVHHHLISKGQRQLTGLIVETAEARDVMHFATLLSYGASAINPYLAFESIADLKKQGHIPASLKMDNAIDNYITAIKRAMLKIMAKNGISTIRSFRGGQVFEAFGLGHECINRFFPGTDSCIGGIELPDIERECRRRHREVFTADSFMRRSLITHGVYRYRNGGLPHLLKPAAIPLLQQAVKEGNYALYKQYADRINERNDTYHCLTDVLTFRHQTPIAVEAVESEERILQRFTTAGLALGSISLAAQEAIAEAMNALSAASNCGEGGEPTARLEKKDHPAYNAVKQIGSSRFSVTSLYLVRARELQIKICQGAKPGEGGILPAYKVSDFIASVRRTPSQTLLISPPAHHDVYTIEDLARLIDDLRMANLDARISVKLAAETGIGRICAAVAKCKADAIVISGCHGGTGAAPLSSMRSAALPWEVGLAQTQHTLVLNELRHHVVLQVDGKLRSGRDVVIAALLGAEEYAFGTLPLIALGCCLIRNCHLNTCAVGIATQQEQLCSRFSGKPEFVTNLMRFIAREVRGYLAQLGAQHIDEIVGRCDLLEIDRKALSQQKINKCDFSILLQKPAIDDHSLLRCTRPYIHHRTDMLDEQLIQKSQPALERNESVNLFAAIGNTDCAVGARLSSEVSKRFGSAGLAADTIRCKFSGSAGQSFGAFLTNGITFELEGDANDFVGKGLCGGRIILTPTRRSQFRCHTNCISGNADLYGATSGQLYINGMSGERFAIRNSGATAVVEGVGDHGCEYMSGGTVVILGRTGINFAAGMIGGMVFVLDDNQLFDTRCNLESVDVESVTDEQNQQLLLRLVQQHVEYTGSEYAKQLLTDWAEALPQFVQVIPRENRHSATIHSAADSGQSSTDFIPEELFPE